MSQTSRHSPVWPEWMPKLDQDSYSFQPEDLRESTETEVGAIIRPQFKSDLLTIDCSLALGRVQSAWFESFEKMANRENLWFSMPIWYCNDIRYGLCMFKTRPKWKVQAYTTIYSFSLVVDKRYLVMDECLLDLLDCWTPSEGYVIGHNLNNAIKTLNHSTALEV